MIQSIQLGSTFRGLPLWINLVLLTFFIGIFLLSKKGFPHISSQLFIWTYFLFSIALAIHWGVELIASLMFFALIIVMSGILVNSLFAFFITMAISFTLFVLHHLQTTGVTHPKLYWKLEQWGRGEIITVGILFFIIATVSWLSNREIEKSLKRARNSETALKEERDMLEIRVDERTRELQKTQMEKIAQLSRFAEFGRLSSGLFHDLVNPLTAVSLNIEKMKSHTTGQGEMTEIEEDLIRAKKATAHMQALIQAVRKQMSQQTVQELFSINEEIKEAIQVLHYRARKNNVSIEFQSQHDIQTFGDSIKFSQVASNLLSNAIDAYVESQTPSPGRKVRITLKQKNSDVILEVNDRAHGIPADIIDTIFEPFFTTKQFHNGIGLGLSITKNIIEKDFGGTITVQSNEQTGTNFTVTFHKRDTL